MLDQQKQVLSATREVVAAHIDLSKRRSVPFEPHVLSQLTSAPQAVALPGKLTEAAAQQFALDWVEAWNRRDVEAVLAHFAEDAIFVSPKAERIFGTARLEGKAALRSYWQRALAQIAELRFELEVAHWSARSETLTVVYQAALGGASPVRATELMSFRDGRVVRGEALYGAAQNVT
ncbi:MAG: nuclear transport factor 2 family protein [Myxococcales bacterium]|nr:MAG: nuclear transport factor 2 family protein [Myxococcales bacterium]